jgi:hypothetical protein
VSLTWPPQASAEPERGVESIPSTIPTDTSHDPKVVAGPIPRSWTLKANTSECDPQTRRVDALSVVLSRLPSRSNITSVGVPCQGSPPPPLTLLCLRRLLSFYPGPEFGEYVVPFLPPHLRCELLRYTAVHSPLPSAMLYALCEPEGHADGELIVIGPQAILRTDHFRKMARTESHCIYGGQYTGGEDMEPASRASMDRDTEDEEWDTSHEEWFSPAPLQTFILLSSHISTSTLFTLPPTLTGLALVNLPIPIPLHRLPGICPLLSILDLSYNVWLVNTEAPARVVNPLDRISWSRWNKLRVLALRGCHPSVAIIQRVNQGRWTDVEIIQ